MIDVDTQINTVSRTVGSTTWQAGEASTATISQTYDTDAADLWDAVTNAERLPRWFAPVTGDLELGGLYQIEGNAGGTVEECDPPKKFVATWELGGGKSWIEVRVAPDGDGARLELEHIGIDIDPEHWATFGPGAVGVGWDLAFAGLYRHLSTGVSIDPTEAEEWALSPEGVDFATRASRQWQQADVAAGTDPATAKARAEAVATFFTTPSE